MFFRPVGLRYCSVIIFIPMLFACVEITSVKDVAADPNAHMAKVFSPTVISPSVSKKIPEPAVPNNFSRIKLWMEATSETSDGKKESWKSTITMVNVGNGLVQRMTETFNNDIAYAILYSLNYQGFVDLRWQLVNLRATNSNMAYEIKNVTRFDPIPTEVGQNFEIDYEFGTTVQILNFLSRRKVCKTTGMLDAKTINTKLSGSVLEIACDNFVNNVVSSRGKWLYLQKYGVAITIEDVDSSRRNSFRVVDIEG